MLRNRLRKLFCILLSLLLLLGSSGCGIEKKSETALSTENPTNISGIHENTRHPTPSAKTILSAKYDDPVRKGHLDNNTLTNILDLQTFELDCPIFNPEDGKEEDSKPVFVKLQLPIQWTQDSDSPTLFHFPDGSKAMQIELHLLKRGECAWSAERLWEDESCINYFENWINYSWKSPFSRYTFTSIHTLDSENDLYDYTYYLPYGSAYFAIHFNTIGQNNEQALHFQKFFLETIQLLTPIPPESAVFISGETWKTTVLYPLEENSIKITLDVPVEWAQEHPNSNRFYTFYSVLGLSEIRVFPLDSGKSVWDIAQENLSGTMFMKSAVVNGVEVPRNIFTPPYKPGTDSSEEFGPRICYYYLPFDDLCLSLAFSTNGVENEKDIQLHRQIMETIEITPTP